MVLQLLDYCNFSYGGGYSSSAANIVIKYEQGSKVSLSNCDFSNSAGYGIMLDQPNTDTNYPSLTNNTYSDNTSGDKKCKTIFIKN